MATMCPSCTMRLTRSGEEERKVSYHKKSRRNLMLFQGIQNRGGISVFIAGVKGQIMTFSSVSSAYQALYRRSSSKVALAAGGRPSS